MKKILFIFILSVPILSFSQQIVVDQFDVSITTKINKLDREYVDSVFNLSRFQIVLVKLLPDSSDIGSRYNESIIIDDYNWSTPVSDSTFGTLYFKDVNNQYIDSTSLVEVDGSDYFFFLSELFEGKKEMDENELIDICYNPRHAVLFINDQDEVIAIQEICFECGHTKVALYTSEIRHNSSYPFFEVFKKYKMID